MTCEPKVAVLRAPEKPSIAVLAFQNLSGDPEQEYFSDGIADDITTAFSRTRSLFVTSRNSSFTYKGGPVDVKRVAREMGVRYVVEGSAQRAGTRVRITAQLIDAESGGQCPQLDNEKLAQDLSVQGGPSSLSQCAPETGLDITSGRT